MMHHPDPECSRQCVEMISITEFLNWKRTGNTNDSVSTFNRREKNLMKGATAGVAREGILWQGGF
ncbi:hypothetical protein HanOQP8_Chr12g0429891 [Helianthus annuus]|nr:hypothetical protein HanOQP8_Chr12g0429891 [Helianthus annuus]